MHWKDFKMQHIKTEKWDEDTYFNRIEEIASKKSSKILIKVNLEKRDRSRKSCNGRNKLLCI